MLIQNLFRIADGKADDERPQTAGESGLRLQQIL